MNEELTENNNEGTTLYNSQANSIEEDQTMFKTIQNETDKCMNDAISAKAAVTEPEKAEKLQKNQEIALDYGTTLTKEDETAESQKILVPAQAEELTIKGDNPQPSSHANAG
ncbi:19720_t:CDS:2 [Gigaspora margarita]|uniref:19720_t:CDS:1 n=1 Tax=Gigaspora margarita TaxID=4874 RepID=A0ABN7UJD6_GIGMA|nr:19720_t:CDS:2 [Gigaspora margarita]